jgi:hypothetical protein
MKIAVKNGPGWTFPKLLWLRMAALFYQQAPFLDLFLWQKLKNLSL